MTFLDSLNRFVKCNCLAKQANISRRVSKLTFWALALRQSTWTNCGLCVCSNVEDGATLLVWIWWRENKTHYSSLGWFIWTQHNVQLPVGLLAQLVERCTGIAEVMGSNPVRTWIFFRSYFARNSESPTVSYVAQRDSLFKCKSMTKVRDWQLCKCHLYKRWLTLSLRDRS